MYRITFKSEKEGKTFVVKANDAHDAHEWANKQLTHWGGGDWEVVVEKEEEEVKVVSSDSE